MVALFDNSTWVRSTHVKQPKNYLSVVYKFMNSPDKSFFSNIFSFLQCFYELWLIMAFSTLGDFYLNDVKQYKKREREEKENLNTYPFNQTLLSHLNLTQQGKKDKSLLYSCSSYNHLTIVISFGWTEKSCDSTRYNDSSFCKRKVSFKSHCSKYFT